MLLEITASCGLYVVEWASLSKNSQERSKIGRLAEGLAEPCPPFRLIQFTRPYASAAAQFASYSQVNSNRLICQSATRLWAREVCFKLMVMHLRMSQWTTEFEVERSADLERQSLLPHNCCDRNSVQPHLESRRDKSLQDGYSWGMN